MSVWCIKESWEGLVTGNVGTPAENRPPTTHRYFHGATTTPGAPPGFFSIPLSKPGFWLSFLSAQICQPQLFLPLPRCEFRQIVSSSGLCSALLCWRATIPHPP